MWFKMGGQNLEEASLTEAATVPQVAGEPAVVDSGLGGGPTLADGAPQRPVFDVGQTISDVRAASGMDQYIQPQIGGESKVNPGSVMGETIVVPGQQDALVSPSDTIKREPMIGAAPDGGIATVGIPGDHKDEVVDPQNRVTFEPIISTDSDGNLQQGLSVGVKGDEATPAVPLSERKWKGRIPSGTKNNDGTAEPSVEVSDANPASATEAQSLGDPDLAGNNLSPLNPNGQVGDPAGEAAAAPVEPSIVTADAGAVTDTTEGGMTSDPQETVDAGTPPANPDLAAALNSPTNPNAQDRIEPSSVAARDGVLSQEVVDQLQGEGFIKTDEAGTAVVDATTNDQAADIVAGQAEASSGDEVVSAAVEEPAPAPEAPVDEVVTDEPVVARQPVQSADAPADGAVVEDAVPAAETATDTSVMPDAAEPTAEVEDGQQGESVLETDGVDTDGETPIAQATIDAAAAGSEVSESVVEVPVVTGGQENPITPISPLVERNRTIQAEADRLVGIPYRDQIQSLLDKNPEERIPLARALERATAFKLLAGMGVSEINTQEDAAKVKDVMGATKGLYDLFIDEAVEDGGWKATRGLTPEVEEPNDPSGASLLKTAA